MLPGFPDENAACTAHIGLIFAALRIVRDRYLIIDEDEARSEGFATLLSCVRGFDAAKGFQFSSYAVRSIILRVLRQQRKIGERERLQFSQIGQNNTFAATVRDHRPDASTTAIRQEDVNRVRALVAMLPFRQREVIRRRFYGGDTHREIGQSLGFTRERARQVEAQALGRLRYLMRSAA